MIGWPSKRVIVGTMVALAIGAALTVFGPLIRPSDRAEYLWTEAFFRFYLPRDSMSCSRQMIERALAIRPHEPRYQEALVWFSQDNLKRLEQVTARADLCPSARRLGLGLAAVKRFDALDYGDLPDAKTLTAIRAAVEQDSNNAYPRILYSCALVRLGEEEAAQEWAMCAARAPQVVLRYPQEPMGVRDTIYDSLMMATGTGLSVGAHLKDCVMKMISRANALERTGDTSGAVQILTTTMEVGRRYGEQRPEALIHIFIGSAIHQMAERRLKPIYKDAGQRDRLEVLAKQEKAYSRVSTYISKWSMADLYVQIQRQMSALNGYLTALGVLALAMFGFAFASIPATRATRHRGENVLRWKAWPQGWLAKRYVVVNLAAVLLMWPVVELSGWLLRRAGSDSGIWMIVLMLIPYALGGLAQVVVLRMAARKIRARYREEAPQERASNGGLFRRGPANLNSWSRKSMTFASLDGLAFLLGVFLLAIILSKPLVGYHPWQQDRMATHSLIQEQSLVRQWKAEMGEAGMLMDGAHKEEGKRVETR